MPFGGRGFKTVVDRVGGGRQRQDGIGPPASPAINVATRPKVDIVVP